MRYFLVALAIFILLLAPNGQGHATTVEVYAEGSSTATHLTIEIFADIVSDQQGGPLRSAGVKLTYPTALLTNPDPEKNETDWYFGLPGNTISYKTPDTSAAGEVVFILGKFDESQQSDGIDGNRILLGTVIFARIPNTPPPATGDFSLKEGREYSFVDFITTQGQVLDDRVIFQVPIISSQNLHDSSSGKFWLMMLPAIIHGN